MTSHEQLVFWQGFSAAMSLIKITFRQIISFPRDASPKHSLKILTETGHILKGSFDTLRYWSMLVLHVLRKCAHHLSLVHAEFLLVNPFWCKCFTFLTEQNLSTCEWACERTWSGNYVETGFLMFQLSAIVSQSHQIVQSAGWCFKKCTNKWCFFLGKKTCMVCAVFMRLICAL